MLLTKLTTKQKALMSIIRDRWLAIGLATGPCDRVAAEAAVPAVYGAAGLSSPSTVIWLDSPLAGCVGAQVGEHVYEQMRCQVVEYVGGQVHDQVGEHVYEQVRKQVRKQVGEQVDAQVRDQVHAQVGEQVREHVREQIWRAGYGQHDANWLAFYDFFSQLPETKELVAPLAGLKDLSQHVGWWWPFKNAVILTERPSALYRDDQHRLHTEDKMAISYPDGWGVYAWHGVRLSAWMIEQKDAITTEKINKENNQEIRRCMMEIYGMHRYLHESGAKKIHADETGTLLEFDGLDDGDETARFVHVLDPSTDRQYALRVPPTCQTAREGIAWGFHFNTDEYHPLIET